MDDKYRTLQRLASTGDLQAQAKFRRLQLQLGELPIATHTIYPQSRSTAQDDLNYLASQVIAFISNEPSIREYYPDKIAITSMRTFFSERDRYGMQRPLEINYTVGRWRERPARYGNSEIEYFVRAIYPEYGTGIILEVYNS